jgi:PIN like domain
MSRRRSSTKGLGPSRSSTKGLALHDYTFFVDADLSDPFFHAVLTEAGVRYEKHSDYFDEGTDDPVWLRRAGEEGWIVLSHNKKIRKNSFQVETLMANELRAFMLMGDARPNPPGQRSVFTLELARNFVRTLPAVLRFLRRFDGPWIAKLYRPTQFEEGKEPPAGRIEMWLTLQKRLKER